MWTLDPEHRERSCTTDYRPVCVILQPLTHSGMKFANDDDDNILYDSEHRLKCSGLKYLLV